MNIVLGYLHSLKSFLVYRLSSAESLSVDLSFQRWNELCRRSERGSLSACHAGFHLISSCWASMCFLILGTSPFAYLQDSVVWGGFHFDMYFCILNRYSKGIMFFCLIALFDEYWANSLFSTWWIINFLFGFVSWLYFWIL